jgi:tetratricopeptide (TPR) repeat protein
LLAYYEAVSYLPKDNRNYANALTYVGQLEYAPTKDYRKSAQAYFKAIALDPSNHDSRPSGFNSFLQLYACLYALGLLALTSLTAHAQASHEAMRRWRHLDLKADGVPGISADKAYWPAARPHRCWWRCLIRASTRPTSI